MEKFSAEKRKEIETALNIVYNALKEKGYDPISQIVGYTLSSDETYITTYNNARNAIKEFEGEDICQYLLESYFKV